MFAPLERDQVERGDTDLTMEMCFSSAKELYEAVEFGADDGAKQTLGRLAEHMAIEDAA